MSVLFMFFLFLGYLALRAAMDTRQKAARAGAILAMVGALNVPLIKFSVDLFTSLLEKTEAQGLTAEHEKCVAQLQRIKAEYDRYVHVLIVPYRSLIIF